MPLLFLITYVGISYFIYKKNKEDIKKIPLIIQLTGIIAFALLFVYIIYYSEQNIPKTSGWNTYTYSFYVLFLSYLTTFIIYLFKYKKILIKNAKKNIIYNNKGFLEILIDKIYFIIILLFSSIYFLYSDYLRLYGENGLEILMYILLIFSSIYILFENKILSIKYTK
ncbi:MAG: hypothetical protein QM490_00160 [Candidatus Gracilibacteria bacterium]